MKAKYQCRLLLIAGLLGAACNRSATSPTATPTPAATPMVPAPASVNLSGNYTLTIRASSSCAGSLPDQARTTILPAVLKQQDSTVSLMVGSMFSGKLYYTEFPGTVHGNELKFWTPVCVACTCDESFGTGISDHEFLGACGSALATIESSRHVTGAFSGTLEYWKDDGSGHVVSLIDCRSTDHAFALDAN